MEITFDKKIPEEVVSATQPFVENVLGRYDCSKLKDIRFVWSKNASRGMCWYPSRKHGRKQFRIAVYVGTDTKRSIRFVKSWNRSTIPIWDEAGVQSFVPQFQPHEVDTDLAISRTEIAVWIFGHEMYHFLRRTKQVPGQNTQNQADGFGLQVLREFRSS